jgi:hypothetical protein
MTQSQALVKGNTNYFMPNSFEQAEKMALKIANSSLCPPAYKGKPDDVFIAMQMGAEVGLSPMQAIQNIAVIKGRPCLWGDGMLAVARGHKHCQAIRVWYEGEMKDETRMANCGITRKGQPEQIRSFSIDDAKKAGLWKKEGTWSQYPEQMLMWRATGFCARLVFPDALRGIQSAEEVQDYIDITPPQNTTVIDVRTVEEKSTPLSLQNIVNEGELLKHIENLYLSESIEVLKSSYVDAMKFASGDRDALNRVVEAKEERKKELDAKKDLPQETHAQWIDEYNGK